MRLINADALKEYLFRPYSNEESYSNIDIARIIDNQPTQTNAPNVLSALDCISRQMAVDALCKRCDLVSDDEPCTEECNDIKILRLLPSAQPEGINYVKFSEEDYEKIAEQLRKIPIVLTLSEPEIIRCKDCKNFGGGTYCHEKDGLWNENDFCSYAERKEQDDG